MKTAVYFTKSFKPDAKEEEAIAKLREKFRHVSVRNAKLYKPGSGVENHFDAVFGAIKSEPSAPKKDNEVTQPVKPAWIKNK